MRKRTAPRPGFAVEHEPAASPSADQPALLAAFQTLSPNDVYMMAPKESVIRGFDYYRQQRLQDYAWSRDRETLTAWVQGTRRYAVSFSLDDGALIAHCDCPAWTPDRPCKHVLCACFTTVNLLSPEVFRLPVYQEGRRALLRAELLGGPPALGREAVAVPRGARFELVIDARHGAPSFYIRQNGMKVTWASAWTASSTLPPELASLLSSPGFSPSLGGDPLLRYLQRHGDAYPLILETPAGPVPLRWDPSLKCQGKTELQVEGDQVRIRAVCLADGGELTRILRFRSFVADPVAGRLLLLEEQQPWLPYFAFRRRFRGYDPFLAASALPGEGLSTVTLPHQADIVPWEGEGGDTEFTVPLAAFRSVQIDMAVAQADQIVRNLVLKVDGRESPLVRQGRRAEGPPPTYRLAVVPPPTPPGFPSELYRLRAECRWGEDSLAPSASVFELFPYLEDSRSIPAPLRAQKRKAVLYETFFKLLSLEGAQERARWLKTALRGPDFQSRAIRSEAQWILKGGLSAYLRPEVRLQVHAGEWKLRAVDKAREAALYRIPFELFGPRIFRGMPRYDEMVIEARTLFEHLPDLLTRLADAGIELVYEDKAVQVSQWDCSLDVGRGTGIDWFEIRPEIRCDGAVLEESVWRTAVRQGGLLHTEGGLRVLDAPTLERLRALVDLTEQARRSRKTGTRIVRVPRLQIFDWLALREQGVRVALPADDEAVLARLLGFERISCPPLPKGLRATLRPYQQDGYGWLAFLYQHRFGACLADDMGLGKTLQAISFLAAIKEGVIRSPQGAHGPHLVVVPTSLLFNWEQELARFYPGLRVRVYSGSGRALDAENGDVVLTTYGLVRRDIEMLERTAFHAIVFDEAQAVKNLQADTTGAVRRLNGSFKIAMTGTPLENHLGEYFSVVDLCLPGLLGEPERFKADLKRAQAGPPERLLRRTRPFILRRTKAQILHDLPPKVESEVFLELTDRQKALYQQTVAQVRSTIDDAYRNRPKAQAQLIALTAILKLRQVCLSPRLLTGRSDEPSPKLSFLVERLQVLLEEGHSALVFSQFTSFLDLVQEVCERHALPHSRLDGATAPGQRKARVTAFQASDQPGVFLLSLKAGGQGLNLTKATYVFHLDPWWNPAVENQASDRAHRIGQKRRVSIVRILMRHTIEEKMMALKQRKLELYEAVMSGAVRGSGQGVLTKADFEFLLAPSVV